MVEMLDIAFGNHDKAVTIISKLLKLKQTDCKFSLYYTEFQIYVVYVKWTMEAQVVAL